MHTDARKIEEGSIIEGDICIVGAGAAGISMALEWIGTPYKVILLEGGGFDYEQAMQDLYAGKTTGQHYFPLQSCRLHYFGGTTGHWAGFCSNFDEIDFQKRDWIPHSGWPITKKDLDPFYARAQKNLDLGPYEYGFEYWQKQDPKMVPLNFDRNVVWHKMWQFSPPTRFGSKYKTDIVNAKNVHLYTYANVTHITADENVKQITEVTIKNLAGKTHRVRAKHFVLACCSIQNARLLLASNQQAKKGLGNDNDNVGRYFMEHLEIKSAEIHLFKPFHSDLYSWEFGRKARAELAIHPAMQEKHKILNGTASLERLDIANKIKPVIETFNDTDARKSMKQAMEGFDGAAGLQIDPSKGVDAYQLFTRIEQAPNPDSRVTLDVEKDALGVPRAQLHWVLTPAEKRSMRVIYTLIGEQIGKAGLGRVRLMEYLQDEKDDSWPNFTGGGWHHMGTTRMNEDPKQGVVDANCKVHGISNLHIAGASCYATAAAPNPTLTLVALTIRLSDHLKETMKNKA